MQNINELLIQVKVSVIRNREKSNTSLNSCTGLIILVFKCCICFSV